MNELAQVEWMRYQNDPSTGWSELAPGIPSADIQEGGIPSYLNDAWNAPRRNSHYTTRYPALYRYHDCWCTTGEFSVDQQARAPASIPALLPAAGGAGATPGSVVRP